MFGYSKIPIQTSLLKLRYADSMDAVSMFKLVCTLFSFWAIKNRRNPRISFWVVCLTLWFTKKTPPQSSIHLVSFCFHKVDWSRSFRKFVLICLQYGELPGYSPSQSFISIPPWKYQKNLWFSDVFRAYRNEKLAWNEFKGKSQNPFFLLGREPT